VSRRRFAIADCVIALALVAIAFVYGGAGAALLIGAALAVGHFAGWYSLRNSRR
jgi:uncharacterized membrane protein YbjE (DUF340 family)